MSLPKTLSECERATGRGVFAPRTFCRGDAARGLVLRAGVDVKLDYAPQPILSDRLAFLPLTDEQLAPFEKSWTAVNPRSAARFSTTDLAGTLGPAAELKAIELDLNDLFELTKPGSYRVRFVFTTKDSGFVEGESNALVFSVYSPTPAAKSSCLPSSSRPSKSLSSTRPAGQSSSTRT